MSKGIKIGSEKPRECIRKIKKNGFRLKRSKGGHHFFYAKKQAKDYLVLVATHSKELRRESVKNIIRQAGKDEEEWLGL